MTKLIRILIIPIIILITILITGCEEDSEVKENMLGVKFPEEGNTIELSKYDTTNPLVALYIKDYGTVVIELYKDKAPNTVNNFISLVNEGFYDNNTMHRLIPGFVLQGGDPDGNGTGGPGYYIKGEFASNGFDNDIKHIKGIVSMARSSAGNDTAGSQFFIMLGTATHLDGEYAAFGKVIDGYKNVERIEDNEAVANSQTGQLVKNLTIVKAAVDLKGNELVEVEKIK